MTIDEALVKFGGVLKAGKHEPDGEACALELLSVARGLDWTDSPEMVRCFDLRPLNDLNVPDEVRTRYLLPVLRAYDGSLDWPMERQQAVIARLAILTVQRLTAELPGLTDAIRNQCRNATTLGEAAEAAEEAAWAAWAAAEAAEEAEEAAWAAAEAAEEAAWAAAGAARAAWAAAWAARAARAAEEAVFEKACRLWLDALEEPAI